MKQQQIEQSKAEFANVAPPTSDLTQGLGGVISDDSWLEVTYSSQTAFQGVNALASLVAICGCEVPH